MNDEQKAQQYSNLTYGFDRIANEIASIKGESLELNQEQLNKIQKLQEQQGHDTNVKPQVIVTPKIGQDPFKAFLEKQSELAHKSPFSD